MLLGARWQHAWALGLQQHGAGVGAKAQLQRLTATKSPPKTKSDKINLQSTIKPSQRGVLLGQMLIFWIMLEI